MDYFILSEDLLTSDNFETLMATKDPTKKAQLICSKLKKYLIIKNSGCSNNLEYYLFDSVNVLYKKIVLTEDNLITYITMFISKSKGLISDKKLNKLNKIYGGLLDNINSNSTIKTYLPQIKTYLTKEVDFNTNQINEIHFRNGYYSFKYGKFKQRKEGKHFISKFINRNYKEPSQEAINRVMSDIKKVYPDKEERNYILSNFGVSISGNGTKDQNILFLIGKGSAGKSTMLDMAKIALTKIYVHSLPQETLSQSSQNVNKIMNTFLESPCMRIITIDEPQDTKMSSSLFKQIANGRIQTTSLRWNE